MRDAYEHRQLSLRQMAAEAGCGLRTIARWMRVHEIATRSMSEGKKLTTLIGEANPLWKGGLPKCPECGRQMSFYSTTCMKCRPPLGPAAWNWRGDAVLYPGAHDRVKKARGSAAQYPCADCEGPATEWSYDHADPNEAFDPYEKLPYSLDASHYDPRCVTCHRRFDAPSRRVPRPRTP